ncbi:MAG: ribonuclease Y [Chloroflexi bacterium]|jgi:ribonuclease Y|uniref:Ribonuclease Y n=1 Tax=Candidatus Thermofonsia Clade 3 bacterium TaxID=2364212 RepID=A0A2M8QH25_9CHLR|nr:ribonuclease Y [Candidatus Roseilinea sp. NK_OTU-006]PJF49110.1 MAG: ribonuclease Y [Candidatus Thermofonsia Clade 3 bacterium]RMG62763.1 MAG: ribonuclease Y [Chloroflexota bacterium]
MDALIVIEAVIGVIVAMVVGWLAYRVGRQQAKDERNALRAEAEKTLSEAQAKARQILVEAKDEIIRIRDETDQEIKEKRLELQREDDRLKKRREELEIQRERIEQREKKLNQRQSALDKREAELERLQKERVAALEAKLEEVAGMTREDARSELLAAVREAARNDMARVIREVEAQARETAEQRARKLVIETMQRVATDVVAERAVVTIELPSEEAKGRIIGRNGRNVQAFEQAAGVDVIVDDTPETVTISCFDPVRREIARRALESLVRDGRIHPTRIEKALEDARRDVERIMAEEGERATVEAGVTGLPTEIVKTLGRLKYRTSYGQNQLYHSVETAKLAGLLASELKADVKVCKMGGLLHDIGKALDRESEGTHVQLGVDLLRRFNINPKVIHCVESHHHDVPQETLEAVIVEIADAISGSRPGARRETLETYVKRVRQLEEIAKSFKGVSEAYALQAGRELRVIVKPEAVDDLACIQLSRDIAKRIEETMEYPGQIKVTVVRETRAIEYAK